jgi:hypothetical protein
MMIDLRRSRHQSHEERVSEAKVNKNFEKPQRVACDGHPARSSSPLLHHASGDKNRNACVQRADLCMHSASDAFLSCCIYNEEREIFAGA